MNDKNELINEIYDDEAIEMNDFGKSDKNKSVVIALVIAFGLIAAVAGYIGFTDNANKLNKTKEEMISEMYQVESEVLENADQISKEMTDELLEIKEYLTDVEEAINNNESLLNEYSEGNGDEYSELSVTFKNSTSKITNEFNQISGEIKTTKESIEKLIKELDTKESSNVSTIKELINELKETENTNSDKIEKLINELKGSDTKEFKSLESLIKELEKEGTANKETIEKLIKELEVKESDRQSEIRSEFESVKASIKSIDDKFTKSLNEIKTLINDLSKQSDEETKKLLDTLTTMESELSEIETTNLSEINTKISNMETMYSELMENLKTIMQQDFESLNETINNNFDMLSNQYGDLESTINEKFETMNVSFTSGNDDTKDELNKINESLKLVFQYVSDGKDKVAFAITGKGINSSKNATFANLSNDISRIGADVRNVDASKILEGTRVYDGINNTYVDGTMIDRGPQEDFNPSGIDQRTYEPGYYPSSWTVDTTNAYNKGYTDGKGDVPNARISYTYHEHSTSDGTVKDAGYHSEASDGCFTKPVMHVHTAECYETYSYTENEYVSSGWYWTNDHYHNHAGNGTIDACRSCSECGICSMDAPASHGHSKTIQVTKTGQRLICPKTVEYYEVGCGKADFATAGENATIASATIVYE